MRKFLVGAAAAAAILAPAAQASAETNGYIDLSLGQTDVESTDLDAINIGGAGAVDVGGGWRGQFDVDMTRLSNDGTMTTTNLTAHLYKEADNWAVGGVLSSRDYFYGNAWTIGIEGQTHLNNLVLEGEASFGTVEWIYGDDTGTYNLDANGTYYFTPDFSVGVGYQYVDIDELDGGIDTWTADAEYKFSSSPFSVFAGYAQSEIDSTDVDTWRVGGRYAFGDDTLQGRRTTGPRWLRNVANVFLPIA